MTRFAKAVLKRLGVARAQRSSPELGEAAVRVTKRRDPDLEQAVLRVIISFLVFGYALGIVVVEGKLSYGLQVALIASALNTVVGACMWWQLRRDPERHPSLRYIGIVSDLTTTTIGMTGGDEAGVPLIGIYLWVTIGNGFRFGARYLLVSYWVSLVGFGALLIFVPFWQTHRAIGLGFMAVLAVIPLYMLVLLSRLNAQKDAAEQLSNAKSRFVANVSHELRTPLTGVFAVYDLLRMRKMVPDDQELVGMLGSAVNTLKTSVDAILQMSKLEAGAEQTELRPFNLWYFLHQLAASARPQATAKSLAWHLNIEPDVPSIVQGDSNHLSHALGNLVNNAFKFTHSGSVSLRVIRTMQGRVRFEVTDTGIGIPLEQQERLFERFVQVDQSATRRFGGTGLGTSIAHDLVKLMGGRIGVISAPGQGSTFWIELPFSSGELNETINCVGSASGNFANRPRWACARRIRRHIEVVRTRTNSCRCRHPQCTDFRREALSCCNSAIASRRSCCIRRSGASRSRWDDLPVVRPRTHVFVDAIRGVAARRCGRAVRADNPAECAPYQSRRALEPA